MKTKHLIKFLNNSAHLDVDLEFIDVVQTSVSSGLLKTTSDNLIFDHVDRGKHIKLARRINTDHSRNLAVNHLKGSFRAAYIKSLYEAASTYFQEILNAVIQMGTVNDRLLSEHSKQFGSKDIVSHGSYEKLLETIAESLFRQLENERSTKNLIEKMVKKLGLSLNEDYINNALPYFEIRHRLVHGQGRADRAFSLNYPRFGAREDAMIRLSYDVVSGAKENIVNLVTEFDKEVVENNLVSSSELRA